MTIGDIIKQYRTLYDLSLDDFVRNSNLTKGYVSMLENNLNPSTGKPIKPSLTKIQVIADIMNIPLTQLLEMMDSDFEISFQDEEKQFSFAPQEKNSMETLPYFEYPFVPDPIAAGIPSTIEGIEELPRVVIPDDLMGKYARKKNILIMRVNGESMNRVIENGSIIAVKTDVDVNCLKNGDLVVFNHDYEFSLKRFYRTADRLIFKPDSTDVSFMDISYSLDDDVRIVGKVVMSSISYE